ncbi:MAG: 6-pyruvoyl trahydropterin synthase family protein [Candidatus Helarchaeales archaeon]
MKYEIQVDDSKLSFSAAHFLARHPTCGHIHGHNYSMKITVFSEKGLNDDFMVIDFHDLKNHAMEILAPLDHKLLIPSKSKLLSIKEEGQNIIIELSNPKKRYSIPREDVCLLPIPETTAECLAKFFHESLKSRLPNLNIRVMINENIGSHAVYGD